MERATMYASANTLQTRDAKQVLDEFIPKMKWSSEEVILDVGCGPGDVTANVLLPRLPKSVHQVVGTDLSHAMVKHAATKYMSPTLSFTQMDITDVSFCSANISSVMADLLPSHSFDGFRDRQNYEGFTKIFSFYCLHWIQAQRRALMSMERLLSPGGELLLIFLAKSPMFALLEHVADLPKWKNYMTDVSRFVSPYQRVSDPGKEVHNLLTDVGLNVLHCSCREQSFAFENINVLKNSVTAVNPFLDRIPMPLHEEYAVDCILEVKRHRLIETNNNEDESVNTRYSLIVAHAQKPIQY